MADFAPHSLALEEAFVACALYADSVQFHSARCYLSPEWFVSPFWGACFQRIVAWWDEHGERPDPMAIARQAAAIAHVPENVACADVTRALADGAAGGAYAPHRARELRELQIRRELYSVGREAARSAGAEPDIAGVIAYTARRIEQIDEIRALDETGEVRAIAESAHAAMETGRAKGWPTGIADYDRWSQGLHAGHVHLVGGPSGVGKTWLACQVVNSLLDDGRTVVFFSLEMRPVDLWVRLVAGRIGVRAFRLAGHAMDWGAGDWAAYDAARARLEAARILIFHKQRSVAQIGRTVRRLEPDVAVVDYVQLLDRPEGVRNAYEAATTNADDLQALAQRAECALVLLTQQSRASIREGTSSPIQGAAETGRWDQIADFWPHISRGESPGLVVLTTTKSRHTETGGTAVYRLDRATGRMGPVTEGPAGSGEEAWR